MTRQLVFVHGRAQQGKNAGLLKQEWIEAWKSGLAKTGLTLPISEDLIRFPYYGDTLDQLVKGATEDEAPKVILKGAESNSEEQAFVRSILKEVQEKAHFDDEIVRRLAKPEMIEKGPLNWGWVQAILSTLDQHVPGASGASVALFTHDVYEYLKNQGIRDVIDSGIRKAFSSNVESVVVSHSLGTVVAYNVLRRDGDDACWKIPTFITLGSPLAVKVIKQGLAPIRHPRCAHIWFNAMDERDVVALYPLDADHFDVNPSIENKTDVDNPTENRHGISGYLGDPVVAKRIYDALVTP
jgi:hypothetical protein